MIPPEPTSMRDHAVALAKQGFRVFKLPVRAKDPPIAKFPDLASSDPKRVHEMWTITGARGVEGSLDNNIGILTGGDFFVIDVDVKNNKKGMETLDRLIDEGLDTDTKTARSPTGSLHYYYALPDGVEASSSTSKLGPNVDVRGFHGYVVAPGSVTPDGEYEWYDDREMIEAPMWLCERILKKTRKLDVANPDHVCEVDLAINVERCIDFLKHYAPIAYSPGGGRDVTMAVARTLGDYGASPVTACELMAEHWNQTKAKPSWPLTDGDDGLMKVVEGGFDSRNGPIGSRSAAADFDLVDLADSPPLFADPSGNGPANLWTDECEAPDLPLGALPSIIEEFAIDSGRRLGVEPGAVAVATITALGSLVHAGNTLQIQQRNTKWNVKPVTWTAIVAPPGSNKSSTVRAPMEFVQEVDKVWREDYAKKSRDREFRAAAAKKLPKTAEDVFSDADAPPVRRRKETNDATTESVAELLKDNHGGLLYFAEELAGFLNGMDAYRAKGGKDRPFWIQAKDGGPYSVDRKSAGTTFMPNLAVSVLGTIQNEKLRTLSRGLTDDGFLQRFTTIFLKRTGDGEDLEPNASLDARMSALARSIGDVLEPSRFRFAPKADAHLVAIQKFKNAEIARPNTPPALTEWLNKLPNEFGRFSLIFHWIEWHSVCDGRPPDLISEKTADRARRFLTGFVFGHTQKLYAEIVGAGAGDPHAKWIAEYILTRKLPTISKREILRAYGALRREKGAGLNPAMYALDVYDWVRPLKRDRTGVPSSWTINDCVHDGRFAEITERETVRRKEVRMKIAEDAGSQGPLAEPPR